MLLLVRWGWFHAKVKMGLMSMLLGEWCEAQRMTKKVEARWSCIWVDILDTC